MPRGLRFTPKTISNQKFTHILKLTKAIKLPEQSPRQCSLRLHLHKNLKLFIEKGSDYISYYTKIKLVHAITACKIRASSSTEYSHTWRMTEVVQYYKVEVKIYRAALTCDVTKELVIGERNLLLVFFQKI